MIKCPNCSNINEVQKFCGNCGSRLLVDGVELQDFKTYSFDGTIESNNSWLTRTQDFVLKLIIWILLYCVGIKLVFLGSFNLIVTFTDLIKIRRRYFFILSLAFLFFV